MIDDRPTGADPQTGPWCSQAARHRDESLVATASRVERWLLVEHDGAWGPESVPSGRLPPATARALAGLAAGARARLLMVRRPGVPVSEGGGGRQVFRVDSRPGHESVLRRDVADDEALALIRWDDAGWVEHGAPLYLVCTHGRHDRCCALRGRPVAAALAAAYGDLVWECSHVGGERFATNLVALPLGLYVGWVSPEDVVDLVAGLEAGVLPPNARGRSSLPSPVQAAQSFARESLDRWGLDDLALVSQTPTGKDTWEVELSGGVTAVVHYDRAGQHDTPQVLTCDADEAKVAPVFRLVSLRS